MWLSNDGERQRPEPDDERRIRAWVIRLWREDYPAGSAHEVHFSTCPEIEVDYDLYDGYCNDDACSCSWVHLEATLTCPHGVTRELERNMVVAGWVEQLLEKLHREEVRDQKQKAAHQARLERSREESDG